MAKKKKSAPWVLITNITSVGLAPDVEAVANALLIQPPNKDIPFGHAGTRLRGFSVTGAMPTFTVYLDGNETSYELRDAADPTKVFIGEDGTLTPLFSGAILKICGREFALQVSDRERPMAIDVFEDVNAVWRRLPFRVCEFWMFPAMPSVRYLPVIMAQTLALAEVES